MSSKKDATINKKPSSASTTSASSSESSKAKPEKKSAVVSESSTSANNNTTTTTSAATTTKSKDSAPASTATKKSSSKTNNNSNNNNSSNIVRFIVGALLVALVAVLFNRYGGSALLSSSSSSAPTPIATPSPPADEPKKKKSLKEQLSGEQWEKVPNSKLGETLENLPPVQQEINETEAAPHHEMIANVDVQKLTFGASEDLTDMDIIGQKEVQLDQQKYDSYVASINSEFAKFDDTREPVPIVFSANAAAARAERAAVLLEDEWALADFMLSPWYPTGLLRSPSLRALPLAERKLVYQTLFDTVRLRIKDYFAYQRTATSFRETTWAVYSDFLQAYGVSCEVTIFFLSDSFLFS